MTSTFSYRLQLEHCDTSCAVGTYRNIVIVVWYLDTFPESVRMVGALLGRMQQGVGLIQIVDEGCNALSADARRELELMLRKGAGHIGCSTVVFEGQGFRAAAVRGIVTGLALLIRTAFPHHIFATKATAVEWICAQLRRSDPTLTAASVIAAAQELHTIVRRPGGSKAARE